MSERLVVGVDPGMGGGAAALYPDETADTISTPTDDTGNLGEWLIEKKNYAKGNKLLLVVYVERVTGFVGGPNRGSHMFTFGGAFKYVLGFCHGANINVRTVEPAQWQEWCGVTKQYQTWKAEKYAPCMKKGKFSDYDARKKASVYVAELNYPHVKVTLGNADAINIARYARQA